MADFKVTAGEPRATAHADLPDGVDIDVTATLPDGSTLTVGTTLHPAKKGAGVDFTLWIPDGQTLQRLQALTKRVQRRVLDAVEFEARRKGGAWTTQPVAFHEAGHAVADERAEVCGGADLERRAGRLGAAHQFDAYGDDEKGRQTRIVALLAGHAAELRHLREQGATFDVETLLLGAASDLDSARAWYADGESDADWLARAEDFVAREWTAIVAVARELVAHRRLDAEEIGFVVMAADGDPDAVSTLARYRSRKGG